MSAIATRRVALVLNAHKYLALGNRPQILEQQSKEFHRAGIQSVILPVPSDRLARIEPELSPYGTALAVDPCQGSVREATQAAVHYLSSLTKVQRTFFLVADARVFFQAELEKALYAHGRATTQDRFPATLVTFHNPAMLKSIYGVEVGAKVFDYGFQLVQKVPWNAGKAFHTEDVLLRNGFFILPDEFFVGGTRSGRALEAIDSLNFDVLFALLGNSTEEILKPQKEGDIRESLGMHDIHQSLSELLGPLIEFKKFCPALYYPLDSGALWSWETVLKSKI